ncbi:hypothetical protein PVAND_005131 [Polypedilum vanderplanki]|uniref:Cytochrome P450 n=1 Tax=Polypedilum vanderplanki TaxID=319348 RepID=A0A9J6BZG2_POLVA|nr:hypothetical protein PVAND_005131 [Polypedilum vanderplanki]
MLCLATAALVTIWLIHFLYHEMKKPKNFPHGPFFYPIIGNIVSVEKARRKAGMLTKGIMEIAKTIPGTTDLIGFKIGKDRVVFTLSTKAFMDMYTNQDLDGRPFGPFYETRTFNLRRGILFTDSEFWHAQHRFILRQLKDFGFTRKGMIEICENEAEFCLTDFRKMIESHGGKSATVTMPNILASYILNTLWQFMAGIRYDVDNEELRHLQNMLNDLFKSIDMKGALFSHFPFLQYIAPEASGYNSYVRFHNNLHAFTKKEVERHKKNFNPSDEPRDLIDAYLKVLYSGDESGNKIHESFSELQLLAVMLDMFVAGTETTDKVSNFMLLNIVRNPQIQQRAYDEIIKVVGKDRLPKLSDRPNLPYCEAIVFESLRAFTFYAMGIAHRAIADTKLCGFDIPKNTMLISIFNPLNRDPTVFKNPQTFDPENFLDANGKLSIPDKFFPFALGKHRCIGEVLGKSNLFLFCTTLIQNFYFDVPSGCEMPSDEPIEGCTPTVIDYQARITLRN